MDPLLLQSGAFFLFFIILAIAYFVVPKAYRSHRWIILLLGSLVFYYSWSGNYIILLILSALIVFWNAQQIEKHTQNTNSNNNLEAADKQIEISDNQKRTRKIYLLTTIIFLLGVLFVFKYFNLFSQSGTSLFNIIGAAFGISTTAQPIILGWIQPIGLSFYTFSLIGYLIDVYRKKYEAITHFGAFLLFAAFFCTILSGPVERANKLVPQFFAKSSFEYKRVTDGITLVVWGLFKKVVIADRAAIFVNIIFGNLPHYSGIPLMFAIFLFGVQLYADFSGYTDMVRGLAKILGIDLLENFKRPIFANSVAEFWRRWNISLSSWFQDYVFTPLYLWLGRRKLISKCSSAAKHSLSFSTAMILGLALLGLWHGANWTFLLFGLYYGILISLYYIIRKWWDKMNMLARIVLTWVLVNIGWIFFRSQSIHDVGYVFAHLFVPMTFTAADFNVVLGVFQQIALLIGCIIIALAQFIEEKQNTKITEWIRTQPVFWRWSTYYAIILIIVVAGIFGQSEFIYFKF